MSDETTPIDDGPIADGPLMRVIDMASWVLMAAGGFVIILLMLHITADVAGKYFFNRPIIGTLEIVSRYYMVAVVFLPLAYVQIRRQHLTVEMFTMGLSKRRLAGLDGAVSLVGLVYVALLTWLVYGHAVSATRDISPASWAICPGLRPISDSTIRRAERGPSPGKRAIAAISA